VPQAYTEDQLVEQLLLRREVTRLALSGHSRHCNNLSDIGQERTLSRRADSMF
jgi:hypothetical protein